MGVDPVSRLLEAPRVVHRFNPTFNKFVGFRPCLCQKSTSVFTAAQTLVFTSQQILKRVFIAILFKLVSGSQGPDCCADSVKRASHCFISVLRPSAHSIYNTEPMQSCYIHVVCMFVFFRVL